MNSHDLKDNLNNFFSSYAFYIALGVVILIAIAIVLIFVLSRRKNKTKINKQEIMRFIVSPSFLLILLSYQSFL